MVEISNKSIDIKYDLTKPEGDGGRRADYSKANRLLGWSPKVNIEEGLKNLYGWIEDEMSEVQSSGS